MFLAIFSSMPATDDFCVVVNLSQSCCSFFLALSSYIFSMNNKITTLSPLTGNRPTALRLPTPTGHFIIILIFSLLLLSPPLLLSLINSLDLFLLPILLLFQPCDPGLQVGYDLLHLCVLRVILDMVC